MPHPVSNAIHYVVHNIRQANGLTATTPVGLTDERLELIVRGAVAAAETLAQEAADDARAENPLTPDQHARGERDDAVEVLREVYARALDKAMAQLPGKAPASAWEVVAEDIAKRANRRGITLTEDPA